MEPDDAGGKMNGGEEVACDLIITRGDRAKLLEFGEEVLDQMPRRVHMTIEFSGLLAICLRRDDRGFSRGGEWLDYSLVGVERLIGEQHVGLHVRQKFVSSHQIMGLATGQMETNRVAEGVNQGMDFGAQSATRPSDRLVRPVFF
jgi:hypothetical protein